MTQTKRLTHTEEIELTRLLNEHGPETRKGVAL